MKTLELINNHDEGCYAEYAISRENYNNILDAIGRFDKKIITGIKQNIINKKHFEEIERDSMENSDPGILVLGTDGKFYNCLMWWENEDIEIVVGIDDKYFNSSRVCYIKNKHTNDVQRHLLRDSSDMYFSNLEMGISKEEIEEKLLDLNSSDLNNIILQYREIRPIISKDGCGMDYEYYPNSEEWLGCYVDVSGLGWFIKYIFNKGLANIAIIE